VVRVVSSWYTCCLLLLYTILIHKSDVLEMLSVDTGIHGDKIYYKKTTQFVITLSALLEYYHVGYRPVPTTGKATLSLVSAWMGDRLAEARSVGTRRNSELLPFVDTWISNSVTRRLLNPATKWVALRIRKRSKCKGRCGACPYVKSPKCEWWIGRMWIQAFMAYFKELILALTACNSCMSM
jgi:hypothetical protein